jgi:hypothetical protein
MVASSKKRVFRRSKLILESKDTALITQGMFKVFSRPQIDLEDIMKSDVAVLCRK